MRNLNTEFLPNVRHGRFVLARGWDSHKLRAAKKECREWNGGGQDASMRATLGSVDFNLMLKRIQINHLQCRKLDRIRQGEQRKKSVAYASDSF